MTRQSTRERVCDKLLESLGSAQHGSRELDVIICNLFGDTSSEAGKMIRLLVEEGYPWPVVSELLDEDLPPYTTVLDAALPGENIVLTLYSSRRGRWAAVHETPAGEQVLVWAAGECLARRRAAITALGATLSPRAVPESGKPAARPGPRAVPRPPSGAETAPPAANRRGWSLVPDPEAAPEDVAEEGEEEWKILF